jgi:hypothetical protein
MTYVTYIVDQRLFRGRDNEEMEWKRIIGENIVAVCSNYQMVLVR